MKKIPIYLSILALCLITSPPGLASAAIRDDDTIWWSVSEMIEFARQVDIEKEEHCHGNIDCERNYLETMQEQDDKYRALENFTQGQIWLTSINPSEETIKVLFFDEDMMLKHMGITEKLSLEHIYYGWFDNWNGQIYNYNHEQFTNGSMEGVHTIYDGSAEQSGKDWIPAWQEVELSVAGSNLSANTSGRIGYAAFADSFNAQGQIDYSSCLRADDYKEGKECRLMFSADKWVSYFPPRAEIDLNEPSNQDDNPGNTEGGTDTNSDISSGDDGNDDNNASTIAGNDPGANTGSNTDNNEENNVGIDDGDTNQTDYPGDNADHGAEDEGNSNNNGDGGGGKDDDAGTHENGDPGNGSGSNSGASEQSGNSTDSENGNSGVGTNPASSSHTGTIIILPSIQVGSTPSPAGNPVINNNVQNPQPLTGYQNAQIASATYPYSILYENPSSTAKNTQKSRNTANITKSTSSTEDDSSKSQKESTESSQGSVVNLPSAGEFKNNCEKIVNFPWWLIVLLVIGDLLILWFVWPRSREER